MAQQQEVTFSATDRSLQLGLSEDRLIATGEKGYRMIRATEGARESGIYYYELEILREQISEKAHFRVGFSTSQADIQAPVGYDQHGYGYCDVKGSCVHRSRRNDEYGDAYGPGDVIGLMIKCEISPPPPQEEEKQEQEEAPTKDTLEEEDKSNPPNPTDTFVRFFKNGADQGIAYDNLPSNVVYYPAVSLYQQAKVKANFGPKFAFPPSARDYPNCQTFHVKPASPDPQD